MEQEKVENKKLIEKYRIPIIVILVVLMVGIVVAISLLLTTRKEENKNGGSDGTVDETKVIDDDTAKMNEIMAQVNNTEDAGESLALINENIDKNVEIAKNVTGKVSTDKRVEAAVNIYRLCSMRSDCREVIDAMKEVKQLPDLSFEQKNTLYMNLDYAYFYTDDKIGRIDNLRGYIDFLDNSGLGENEIKNRREYCNDRLKELEDE